MMRRHFTGSRKQNVDEKEDKRNDKGREYTKIKDNIFLWQ